MNQTNSSELFQLLREAVEGGRVGTWYWDVIGDSYVWSNLCKKYLALPEGTPPSAEYVYSILHPEDRERVKQLIKNSLESKIDNFDDEHRVVDPNGEVRWLSVSCCVRKDIEGHPYAMAGTVEDITQRKTTELQLQATIVALKISEQRFSLAMEAAQEGIWDWRLDTNEVYYSPGYAAMLGYTPQSIMPNVWFWRDFLHPDEAESVFNEANQRLQHPGHYVLEFRLRHVDGSYRWILSKGKVIERNDLGKPLRAIGTHIDITERKISEARLKESQYLLDLALAGAELGTWDIDIATGRRIYDERYYAMLGYQAGEIDPSMDGWLRLIHPDDQSAANEAMRAHLARETRIYEVEHRLRHKAGHWIWVLTRGKVTYNAARQPLRASGTLLDITDRKRVSTEGADLLRKIEALIAGLDRKTTPLGANDDTPSSEMTHLSPRNRQVLGLLAEGLTSAEIADRLGISNETVMTHRRNLMRKLGLRNKAELIRYALRHNIGAS
jgi:PAS domain S-box-containing protein